MPRISDPPTAPADIWTYTTRTLTAGDNIVLPSQAFPFTNPPAAADLPNVQMAISPTGTGREARLDNLDVAISSRQPQWTFTRYADVTVPAGSAYTPAVSGLFVAGASTNNVRAEYYSSAQLAWYAQTVLLVSSVGHISYPIQIGDGTNFRFFETSGTASIHLVVMRAT